ncbi:hypothetical protein HYH02_011101 [Chlamydomonas schloesseri]|uniref:Uncharacterized protein n=1 Tax=Chlamydomonas schloesseri TaxID=2026947 RepID=A0A835T2Q3_9CHLO|nr:hypothetical protein HYH02_011101 [Chlamydomonas schloesseri]|eukprot:KAG2437723.1 hypothetical protein HYH02_011101 [Chlamydomonas schloesseri]
MGRTIITSPAGVWRVTTLMVVALAFTSGLGARAARLRNLQLAAAAADVGLGTGPRPPSVLTGCFQFLLEPLPQQQPLLRTTDDDANSAKLSSSSSLGAIANALFDATEVPEGNAPSFDAAKCAGAARRAGFRYVGFLGWANTRCFGLATAPEPEPEPSSSYWDYWQDEEVVRQVGACGMCPARLRSSDWSAFGGRLTCGSKTYMAVYDTDQWGWLPA